MLPRQGRCVFSQYASDQIRSQRSEIARLFDSVRNSATVRTAFKPAAEKMLKGRPTLYNQINKLPSHKTQYRSTEMLSSELNMNLGESWGNPRTVLHAVKHNQYIDVNSKFSLLLIILHALLKRHVQKADELFLLLLLLLFLLLLYYVFLYKKYPIHFNYRGIMFKQGNFVQTINPFCYDWQLKRHRLLVI